MVVDWVKLKVACWVDWTGVWLGRMWTDVLVTMKAALKGLRLVERMVEK